MPVADRAQFLQIPARRNEHARGARDGLDDDRRNGRRVVQRDDAFQIVGEMAAPVRLAAAVGHLGGVVGMRQVVDARQEGAEEFAVVRDAADRSPAEADAVIAAFAPDQARPVRLAAMAVPGERDLERRVDRLRARIAEEDVVQVAREHCRQPRREFERAGMAALERRRVVHALGL